MIKVDHHVTIRRSPKDVFDYIAAVERMPEWRRAAGIRKVTKHAPGPLGLRQGFTIERAARRGIAAIDAEVTAFEPGSRFDFHTIDDDRFAADFATTLTQKGGGTDLHWSVRMRSPSLLYLLIEPIFARAIRNSAEADFEELRAKLEAEASGPAS